MKRVGIVGYPLGHSISPSFQQAAFDYLGLEIQYETWEIAPDWLYTVKERLCGADVLGANVTVPYKEAILPLLDGVEEICGRIGAVNTIVNRNGKLIGYNTDADGFIRALKENGNFDPLGEKVVVLGAGGVARAVVFALAREKAGSIAIVNRNYERARILADDVKRFYVDITATTWEKMSSVISDCDLFINCTSFGMKHSELEGQSPLNARSIPKRALVYDLVYNPQETQLMLNAKRAGARTLGGLPMLVFQGAIAFEIWTGKQAPVDVMINAAKNAV